MPIAGKRPEDRAEAHIRWAERYSRTGKVSRAISHFGRAVDYNRMSTSHFGTGDVASALTSLAPTVAAATTAAGAAAYSLLCTPGSQCTAPPKRACDLCATGGPVDRGVQGEIYDMRDDRSFVVKLLKDPELAKSEAHMMGRMLEITHRTNGAFRSLQARLVDSGSGPQLVIERYKRPMRRYLFDIGDTKADKLRIEDKVEKGHFVDILDQFRILHRFGVAHGDAHGGNVGLVVKPEQRRFGLVVKPEQRYFVIADPTKARESPFSDLFEMQKLGDSQGDMTAAEYAALRVLYELRAATKQGDSASKSGYKYALNKKITDLGTEEAVLALMDKSNLGLSPTERIQAAETIGGLVDEHNSVVDLMQRDWKTLHTVMQGYTQHDKEFKFSDDEASL